MKQFIIEENVRNGTLQYLSMKPYAEVAELIQLLLALKEIPNEVQSD
jgi:hypothetical protein